MSAAAVAAAGALGADPVALGVDDAGRRAELAAKLARVQTWLEARGADAWHARQADHLTWLTGGADLLVYREGAPVAEAVVVDGGLIVVTDRIEAKRLEAEELPPGTRVEAVDWFEPGARAARVQELLRGRRAAGDADAGPELHQPLLAVERARLAAVGSAAARAFSDAVVGLAPEHSERQAAARLQGALRAAGVDLPVVLVAGEGRLGTVRHPVPTDAPLGRAALLVVCAQRFGLIASLSRLVAFGAVPDGVAEALPKVRRVEAAMLAASRPGVATADVLAAARAAYAAEGAADAWRDHHQGGPVGYRPRAWLATPGERRSLQAGMALAWNPSLPWAKAEDTFALGADGALANLTWDPRWPADVVAGRARAAVRVL